MTRRVLAAVCLLTAALVLASCRRGPRDLTAPSADGLRIAYHVEGRGNPTLVFVHCWSCDRSYWSAQVPVFSKTHRVVTVDLAGHGASEQVRKAWTMEAFGADVAAVLKEENLKNVILIGHSMGGEVVLEAARLAPKRVIGIVGVDTFQDLTQTISPDQIEGFLASFRTNFAGRTEEFVRAMFPASADPALVAKIAKAMASGSPRVGLGALESSWRYRPEETLKSLRIPIKGINSDLWPVNVDRNRTLVPRYSVKIMKGFGHFIQIEDPAAFNRLLRESIEDIVSGK
jgi:pimeloyl-ACP methyl ester carboxylesterase